MILSKDLLVSKTPGAYLLNNGRCGMNVVAGRRGVLRTFALTMATGVIGLASAATRPVAAAVDAALTPPGAAHLGRLKKRLAQGPRRRGFKPVPRLLNNPGQRGHDASAEVLY